jgi:RimJ/RimL family protein N-acetyltransferase
VNRYALIALDPAQPDEIIGVVRFDHEANSDHAEYAAVIADAWQHRGLGGRMTRALVLAAWDRGIHWFDAFVMPDNRGMIRLFERLGLPHTVRLEAGDLRVTLDLRPAAAHRDAFLAGADPLTK